MKELAKNAIKKIGAVVIGSAMLGATVFSAVAADLKDYPQPFVKNGVFSGEIVVGGDAKVADVVGAIDVSASLQYAMKVAGTSGEASSEGGVVTVETSDADIEGGALIKNSGNDLNLGDDIATVLTSSKLTDKELPTLLADGIVVDEDSPNEELDYEQSIVFSSGAKVSYDRGSDIGDEENPSLYVDISNSTFVYDFVVDLKDAMNFSMMGDSEKITIAGKEFTVKPNLASGATQDLVLLGSDETVILELGETKTIAGVEYTLLGANADNNNAILKVGSTQKTITQGNSYTISGQEVYVKSLYITTIPTTSASLEIMVGSQEMSINGGSFSALKVNDETVKGVQAKVTGGTSEATKIEFEVTPSNINDANKYLEEGTEFVDPVFGFKLSFSGASEALDASSKAHVGLEAVGDNIVLTFTNDDGDEYSIDVYSINSTGKIDRAENFYVGVAPTEDSEFILSDSTGKVTYVYQVIGFDEEDTKNTTTVKDMSTGKEYVLENGDVVGDSNVNISLVRSGAGTKSFALNTASLTSFKIENEGLITLGAPINATYGSVSPIQAIVSFTEASKASETTTVVDDAQINITITDDDLASATTNEIVISAASATDATVKSATDKDANVGYILTEFGTYVKYDKEDKLSLDLYYPKDEEVDYYVSVTAGESTTTQATKEYSEGDVLKGIGTIKAITAGSVTGGSYNINKIALPLAKLDVDTTIGSANQIIVGGPAVNRLAAEAIGVSYPSYGLSSGLFEGQGEAVIKLVEQGTKVAIVVAGWEAGDTQRATTVLANYAQYASKLTGKEVKITGTVSSPVISLVVEEEPVAAVEETPAATE